MFKWVEDFSDFDEGFINSYNVKNKKGFFFDVEIQYPGELHERDNDLLLLQQRMKIKKVVKRIDKLHNKNEYVFLIKNLKQDLKKVHSVIKGVDRTIHRK